MSLRHTCRYIVESTSGSKCSDLESSNQHIEAEPLTSKGLLNSATADDGNKFEHNHEHFDNDDKCR